MALAQIPNSHLNSIDLHRSTSVGPTTANCSCLPTPPNDALDRLATTPTPRPRDAQIPIEHAAGPYVPFPRFPPLEVFRRRPPVSAAPFVSGRHPKSAARVSRPAL